ncbi:MAG: energy transducer TonB [Planctomycetes bacterium]|nr:energy transducer TonB [Planctomycetota bacterium]
MAVETRKISGIKLTLIISVAFHLVVLIILPALSFSKPYQYTSRDLDFIFEELRAQPNNLKSEQPEPPQDAPKVTPDNPEAKPPETPPQTEEKDVSEKNISVLPEEIKPIEQKDEPYAKPEETIHSTLTPEQAQQKLKELEEFYDRSNLTPELRLRLAGENKPYLKRVQEQIQAKYFVPEEAKRQKLSGKVTVKITVNPKGEILDAEITNHSDFPILDMAALETVKAAAPFPDISKKVDMPSLTIIVPFIYQK